MNGQSGSRAEGMRRGYEGQRRASARLLLLGWLPTSSDPARRKRVLNKPGQKLVQGGTVPSEGTTQPTECRRPEQPSISRAIRLCCNVFGEIVRPCEGPSASAGLKVRRMGSVAAQPNAAIHRVKGNTP